MEEENEFNGFWIPPEVWNDRSLSLNEKCYLSLYIGFGEDKADELMKYNYSPRTIFDLKKKLTESGRLIKVKYPDPYEAKEFAIRNSHKGKICEWCGKESYILHNHHFPIQKKDGGTKTVKICPNCHSTFHVIMED